MRRSDNLFDFRGGKSPLRINSSNSPLPTPSSKRAFFPNDPKFDAIGISTSPAPTPKIASSPATPSTSSAISADEWQMAFNVMSKSAVQIQKVFRGNEARKVRNQERLSVWYMTMVKMKLMAILKCRVRPRIRARRVKFKNDTCCVIQRYMRGCIARKLLYRKILASFVICNLWKKHKLISQLRFSLRRLNRPLEIVLHGLRDLACYRLQSDHIQVRIKIWWHKLLHLANSRDTSAILDTKKPHFVQTIGRSFGVVVRDNKKSAKSMAVNITSNNSTLEYNAGSARHTGLSDKFGLLKGGLENLGQGLGQGLNQGLNMLNTTLKLTTHSATEGVSPETHVDTDALCDINFEDEVIRIGSCHGDSIILFEIMDGE